MLLLEAQLTAAEVLRTFHHDEPYLFLGSAFTTVGIVAAAFCVLRRRFDALVVWMAIFAALYGQRLWMQADLLRIAVPNSEMFHRLREAINYVVPIPAFIFFQVAGFFGRGKVFVWAPSMLFSGLVIGTMAFGPLPIFHTINNGAVISILIGMTITLLRTRSIDRDFKVVRWGLLSFAGLALWDNLVSARWLPQVEPYGFAILLGCLGYVSARRMLDREQQLSEIEVELELARRIQLSILPAAFPASANFKVAARYVPMTSVAGDLYDFLVAEESEAGLLIADVSGHGVPAALIASMVKMAAVSQRAHAADPAQLLAGMNAALCGNTQKEFVTAAYVHLDAEVGELRYSAAGHPPMLLLRAGQVIEIIENGLLLAATDLAEFSTLSVPLRRGDRLMLYTDGLLEAKSMDGTLFGEASLQAALRATDGLSPAAAVDQILAAVQGFATLQDDDLTLLICDFQPVV